MCLSRAGAQAAVVLKGHEEGLSPAKGWARGAGRQGSRGPKLRLEGEKKKRGGLRPRRLDPGLKSGSRARGPAPEKRQRQGQ